jgi:hypothetical protein
MSDDNLEERNSSIPIEPPTEDNVDPEDEDNDPMNPEAFSIDPKSLADDTSDTVESTMTMMLIVLPLLMQLRRRRMCSPQRDHLAGSPTKMIYLICKFFPLLQDFPLYLVLILPGLYAYSDECFIEPPPKKAKTSSSKTVPAASEASAPATTPAAQVSTASSLFKGKEIPLTDVTTTSPLPEKHVSFLISIIRLPLTASESL